MKIWWLSHIRDPKAPTREEVETGTPIDLGALEGIGDVGEPPIDWCDERCDCGDLCREFVRHRGPCDCGGHWQLGSS
jgi:hypothetical protein